MIPSTSIMVNFSLKKVLTLLFFLLPLTIWGQSNSKKPDLDSLDYYLSKEPEFNQLKENKISKIKTDIKSEQNNSETLYLLYEKLYEEYNSYNYDSAYVCVEKLLDISNLLKDKDKIISSRVKMGFCFLSSGLFKECFDLFSSINIRNCSTNTKIDYYTIKSRLYYDLADYNNDAVLGKKYEARGNEIIDSAIVLLPVESSRYWSNVALKRMKSDNDRGAIEAFRKMIRARDYSQHDFAIATSSIAYILSLQGKTDEAKQYLTEAAIADIKSSTKETVALKNLAQILYEEGDLTHAATYIHRALDDASFYNARLRQLEIGHILPIIEGERINSIEKQRDRITVFFIVTSILMISLIVAFLIIRKQLRRLKHAKQVIHSTNENLDEANKIKDEYIGYFFILNSEFIEKMDAFQKYVKKKASERKYEELITIPKNLNVYREREELFIRFDEIFLKLFPDFVDRFNELLNPEEQIQLKKGELLNAELRIYALIRLGISDSEKIAHFLDYSVNTIYTYKTKIKNRTNLTNVDFKRKIMEIKSI